MKTELADPNTNIKRVTSDYVGAPAASQCKTLPFPAGDSGEQRKEPPLRPGVHARPDLLTRGLCGGVKAGVCQDSSGLRALSCGHVGEVSARVEIDFSRFAARLMGW